MSSFWDSGSDWTSAPASPTMAASGQDNEMDDHQFYRLLNLFPIVRSRSYCEDDNCSKPNSAATGEEETSAEVPSVVQSMPEVEWKDEKRDLAQSSSEGNGKQSSQKREDIFWSRLKAAAEQKLGPGDAEGFCDAFKQIHENLVHEILSLEAVNKISKNLEQRLKL